ncbi:MAG: hypothetical protein ACL93V_14130 [Candidatus Electrothrix sp. YB6]
MKKKFSWSGYTNNDPGHQTLHGFLTLDVQNSPEYALELITNIQAYLNDGKEQCEGTGNGYVFECQPEGLFLDCLYEGDELTPVIVDYQVVLEALKEWITYCQKQ